MSDQRFKRVMRGEAPSWKEGERKRALEANGVLEFLENDNRGIHRFDIFMNSYLHNEELHDCDPPHMLLE